MKEDKLTYSERIRLNKIRVEDSKDILNLWSKDYTVEFQGHEVISDEAEAKRVIYRMNMKLSNGQDEIFVIRDKNTNELLGQISFIITKFIAEIGLSITKEALGKKISDEALKLVENYITRKCLADRCIAKIHKDNEHSVNLFERSGYKLDEEHPGEELVYYKILSIEKNDMNELLTGIGKLGIDYRIQHVTKFSPDKKKMLIVIFYQNDLIYDCIFTFVNKTSINLNIFRKRTNSNEDADNMSVNCKLEDLLRGLELMLESERKKYGTV